MKPYGIFPRRGGVKCYGIMDEAIKVQFYNNRTTYIYTYRNTGRSHVEEMKILARIGRGLTGYIAKHRKIFTPKKIVK